MKIVLCILTYNEVECLKIIFPKLAKAIVQSSFEEIYAIDGGSTDGSIEYFKKNNINVLIQEKQGRGEAFKLAFERIQADAYIFFSPDGNENHEDLKFFPHYLDCGYDLVIASRMMSGAFNEEDVHWWRPRKWVNLALNFLANFFFNHSTTSVTDSINGFRAIRQQAVRKLNLTASDYTIEYEMTIQSMKKGLNIIEFPTHEGPRLAGQSGVLSWPAGFRFSKRLLLELFK
jgi:glycosyltransferase involved in cell wall biosynthesis